MTNPGGWTRRAVIAGATGAGLLGVGASLGAARTPSVATPMTHATSLIDAAGLTEQGSDPDLRIVALTPPALFAQGRIPGAVAVDWPALELETTTAAAIAAWAGAMRELMRSLGIGPASNVVVYDEGSLFAARLVWVLACLGQDAARALDGGLPAWRAAGLPVPTERIGVPGGVAPGPEWPADAVRPDVLATLAEVEAALGAEDTVLVDARAPEEYAAGHIPGAVNVNYPLNAEPDEPRFWKRAPALLDLYESVGITPGRRVIPYCSTGVRSAVTWFTLRMIGFPDVALFTGSWAEWSAHPELPETTGPNP